MNFAEYVQGIDFRLLRPCKARPKGVRRLSRMLAKFGCHLEIANTRLPENQAETRKQLRPLCRLPRMSTFAIGALIQRAVAELPHDQAFVNVGVWHGFTYFCGLAGNPTKRCIGIDNFSHRDSPRTEFLSRLELLGSDRHVFHEIDFRRYFRDVHSGLIGVYFFDGPHTHADHRDALELAEPFFADGCIIIIDDANWSQVRQATDEFRSERAGRYQILLDRKTSGSGHPTFWNGLMILQKSGVANRVSPQSLVANPRQLIVSPE